MFPLCRDRQVARLIDDTQQDDLSTDDIPDDVFHRSWVVTASPGVRRARQRARALDFLLALLTLHPIVTVMGDMTDDDTENEARKIAEESMEMDDYGPVTSVDGKCSRCDKDAVWRDPTNDEPFCENHAKEFFTERHG